MDFRELALAQTDDPKLAKLLADSSLHFERVPLALSEGQEIICTGIQWPYVPECFRRAIFDALHNLSHPGIRATQRLVTSHFVWPSVNSDVRRWACSCLQCQRAKVHRHTVAPLGTFATPDAHVHIDLVGPLPPSNGLFAHLHWPLHAVARGYTHSGRYCQHGGQSICSDMGFSIWCTLHCHLRPRKTVRIKLVEGPYSAH